MADKDIEMQSKPTTGTAGIADKTSTVVVDDQPPVPPKRDYKPENENSETEAKKKKRFSSFQRPEFVYKPEKDSDFMMCLKNLLILLNFFIWLFGAALTGLGIWVQVDKEFWDIQTGLDMKQFTHAGYILIAAGVIIMFIGFVGCYGALALKLWLLVLYAIIIVIIILMELAVVGIVWSATNNKDTQEEMKRRARKAMQDMNEVSSQRYLINLLQSKLSCCGIDGPDDYGEKPIPKSCTDPDTGYAIEQGCLNRIIEYFKSKAGILGGVAVAVFLLQMAALVFTLCIACGLKQVDSII